MAGISVTARIAMLSKDELEKLRLEAFDKGLDFHSLVASRVTGIAYDHIDPDTRMQAKLALFSFLYGRQGL